MNRSALLLTVVLLVALDVARSGAQQTDQAKSTDALPPTASSQWGNPVRLLLVGERELLPLTISIEIDGQPASEVWKLAIESLFRYCDLDQDGSLSESESRRLPTPIYLRRLLWGSIAAPSVLEASWRDIDVNQDAQLSLDEAESFYRNAGVGVEVSFGVSNSAKEVSDRLLDRLESSGDAQKTRTELAALPKLLATLDLNEDELLSPSEIIPGTLYPGTTASTRIATWRSGELVREPADLLVLRLPADAADKSWAEHLVAHFGSEGAIPCANSKWNEELLQRLDANADKAIDATELVAILRQPSLPTLTARIRSTASADGGDALDPSSEITATGLWLERAIQCRARVDAGTLLASTRSSAQRLVNLFEEADVERVHFVRLAAFEVQKFNVLQRSFDFLDRDADGRLTRIELDAWLKLIDILVRAQVVVRVIDYRTGIFPWLDADGSGSLTVRECRTAQERLAAIERASDDPLQLSELPRVVDITVSHGPARSNFSAPRLAGPAWFVAMDRNSDGDLSTQEWSLPLELFERVDTNGDGLLSPLEATQLPDQP